MSIRQVKWSVESKTSFLAQWSERIRREDLAGWEECGGDVYMFMIMKLQRRLAGGRLGQAGWSMHAALMSDQIRHGVIWADGYSESSQTSLRQSNGVGETWWPALIQVAPGPPSVALVPMYCPALAWQNARPWWANPDRLWISRKSTMRLTPHGS